jgi:hypothetical protein
VTAWLLVSTALAIWWVVIPSAVVGFRLRRVSLIEDPEGPNRSEFCESRRRLGVARSVRHKGRQTVQCLTPNSKSSQHPLRRRLGA